MSRDCRARAITQPSLDTQHFPFNIRHANPPPWSARLNQIIILVVFLIFSPSITRADDQVILEVIVNGHQEGKHFFTLTKDSDLLASAGFLAGIRLRADLRPAGKKKVSLRGLAPDLRFTIDHNNATLTVTVDGGYSVLA